MEFKFEDILAYNINNEIICQECITKEDEQDLTSENIITESEDSFIFCDKCKKKL